MSVETQSGGARRCEGGGTREKFSNIIWRLGTWGAGVDSERKAEEDQKGNLRGNIVSHRKSYYRKHHFNTTQFLH